MSGSSNKIATPPVPSDLSWTSTVITSIIIQSSRKCFLLLADEYRQPASLIYDLTQGSLPWDLPRSILVNWHRPWGLRRLGSRSRRPNNQKIVTQGLKLDRIHS